MYMYISYSVPFVLYKRTRRRRLLICCPSIAAHQQRTSHTHTHTRKKKKLIHFFFYLFFFSIFIFLVFLAIQARAFLDSLALKFFQSSSLFPSLPRVNQYLPPPSHSCYGNAKWARRAREFFCSRSEKETI